MFLIHCGGCSVTQSCLTLCNPMDRSTPGFLSFTNFPEFAQTHVHRMSDANHPTISSSVIPFSCLQSFPASGSFLMSQLFISGSQNIGASASASVLLMKIQGWSSLGLIDLISLQSKELSRDFSNTTVWNCSELQHSAFFMVQLSHPYMWDWKNHSFDYMGLYQQRDASAF